MAPRSSKPHTAIRSGAVRDLVVFAALKLRTAAGQLLARPRDDGPGHRLPAFQRGPRIQCHPDLHGAPAGSRGNPPLPASAPGRLVLESRSSSPQPAGPFRNGAVSRPGRGATARSSFRAPCGSRAAARWATQAAPWRRTRPRLSGHRHKGRSGPRRTKERMERYGSRYTY